MTIRGLFARLTGLCLLAFLATLFPAYGALSPASAATNGVTWRLTSETWPAALPSNGEGRLVAVADNVGYGRTTTEPVSLTDRVPAGLTPQSASLFMSSISFGLQDVGEAFCTTAAQQVTCTLPPEFLEVFPFDPYEQIEMRVQVKVESPTSTAANEVSITGGGGAPTSVARSIVAGTEPTSFGVSGYELTPENADGSIDTQAGSHPFQLTSNVMLNMGADPGHPPALPKDLEFQLPPGLIGNPTAFPQCPIGRFSLVAGEYPSSLVNQCPASTAIGVATVTVQEKKYLPRGGTIVAPLFNVAPAPGEPARFGFVAAGVPVILDTSVRTGGDYGVTVSVKNISELASFIEGRVTFWGIPGDPRHDAARGWGCVAHGRLAEFAPPCAPLGQSNPQPLLSLPTSCTGALQTTVVADSWSEPNVFTAPVAGVGLPGLDGCNRLPFSAAIAVVPDGHAASTATGLTVDVHVPQEEALNAAGLAPSDVRDTSVVLPAGVALNPAGADGLSACSESEILLSTGSVPSCPDAAKVATVTIKTPLLPNPLVGAAYLAAQNANPFGSLVAMYLVARDPVSGVLVKLAGEVRADLTTGQLVATFKNTPQLPFEDAEFHFFGGERAPLATPAHCGAYTTTASIAPWSGGVPASASSTFNITSGPNGSPCPGPSLPFSPSLTGGSTNINAAGFTPLSTTIARADGQQNMQSVQLRFPPGLSGILAGVPLCGEAQANEGACGPQSLIGETTVSAGVGSDPVSVKGGKVYLTGPYQGAPFGLSIVNPVKAGPFDLEHDTANPAQQPACDCVVVRAKIEVDPHTAALTVTTDPSGPHAIPHMIDGIPVQIQKVNVLVNRPGFTFNPTNCSPMSLTGTIAGDEGAISPVSVPFQATNCAVLKFAPKFTVSTSAKTSKANGATLTAKLAEPPGSLGTQANITKVKVELPKQLPSRLTTLQKACTSAQFEANPAGCPSASIIGHATVRTPLLPVPLTGPAIFVSHGGEAFPSLIMVLQGYGVTVDLVGTTFINKAGITSTTFKTVPDVPFSTFELTLPQGKFSALASNLPTKANGSFCGQRLVMPTELIAQNGAVIRQGTPVTPTGCAKKKLSRKQKLAAALKVCRRKAKGKRAACAKAARRKYGAIKPKK
jgi:hypothetical protein